MANITELKKAMIDAGYTQGQLARAIGISDNAMSAKFCNKSSFTITEATDICRILNITDNSKKALIFLC